MKSFFTNLKERGINRRSKIHTNHKEYLATSNPKKSQKAENKPEKTKTKKKKKNYKITLYHFKDFRLPGEINFFLSFFFSFDSISC